jgi:hypothetical protein
MKEMVADTLLAVGIAFALLGMIGSLFGNKIGEAIIVMLIGLVLISIDVATRKIVG